MFCLNGSIFLVDDDLAEVLVFCQFFSAADCFRLGTMTAGSPGRVFSFDIPATVRSWCYVISFTFGHLYSSLFQFVVVPLQINHALLQVHAPSLYNHRSGQHPKLAGNTRWSDVYLRSCDNTARAGIS